MEDWKYNITFFSRWDKCRLDPISRKPSVKKNVTPNKNAKKCNAKQERILWAKYLRNRLCYENTPNENTPNENTPNEQRNPIENRAQKKIEIGARKSDRKIL